MKIETLIQKLQLIQEKRPDIDVVVEAYDRSIHSILAICMTQIEKWKPLGHGETVLRDAVKICNFQ